MERVPEREGERGQGETQKQRGRERQRQRHTQVQTEVQRERESTTEAESENTVEPHCASMLGVLLVPYLVKKYYSLGQGSKSLVFTINKFLALYFIVRWVFLLLFVMSLLSIDSRGLVQ